MTRRGGYQSGSRTVSELPVPPLSVCVPAQPPFEPVLDAIRWIEDHAHGPSRPRRLSCWLVFWRPCQHERTP